MTTTEAITANRAPDGSGQVSARLITRPLLVRFVSVVGTATSFYLLLSAVPLYVRSAGASTGTAGLTTTALTLSSVATYLVTPRLMARYGSRLVLAAGLLALGLPALALAASPNMALIMAACVVRGVGFAVLCVAGGVVYTGYPVAFVLIAALLLTVLLSTALLSTALLPMVLLSAALAAARRGRGRRLRGAGARTADRSG